MFTDEYSKRRGSAFFSCLAVCGYLVRFEVNDQAVVFFPNVEAGAFSHNTNSCRKSVPERGKRVDLWVPRLLLWSLEGTSRNPIGAPVPGKALGRALT